jgi:hypothetical protein
LNDIGKVTKKALLKRYRLTRARMTAQQGGNTMRIKNLLQCLVLLTAALAMGTCTDPGSTNDITTPIPALPLSASMLPASGATTNPSDDAGTKTFFTDALPVIVDSSSPDTQLNIFGTDVSTTTNLTQELQNLLQSAMTKANDFGTTGSFDFSVNLINRDWNSYLTIEKAVGHIKIDRTGAADHPTRIDAELSVQLVGVLKHPLPLNGRPDVIRGARLHINIGARGDWQITYPYPSPNQNQPSGVIAYDYFVDAWLGASFNNATAGGKFIGHFNADNTGSVDLAATPTPNPASFCGNATCVLTVYNDANAIVWTKTFTSLADMIAYVTP